MYVHPRRAWAAAGGFLAGALPALLLCALVGPFALAIWGLGMPLLVPGTIVGAMLGGRAAARTAWESGRAPVWWGVGALFYAALLAGLAYCARTDTGAGRPGDTTDFLINFGALATLPTAGVCLGAVFGVWAAVRFDALLTPDAADAPDAPPLWGATAGACLMPAVALVVAFLWRFGGVLPRVPTGQVGPGSTAANPAPLAAWLLAFALAAAAHCLVLAPLLLLIARAARRGVVDPGPAYLRTLLALFGAIAALFTLALLGSTRPG